MSDIILKIENISKQYRLGTVGTGTISHDLNRWWHKMRGKEDPFLKIGDTNDRSTEGTSEYVWALKDINFEVKRGEVLGIIGKNGAGKSTLLKILSKVTGPTTGSIKSRGRIASLLEVGTGFHPEMTGRENIFLNGAILGMTKKEINSKLEEIIDFSGCQRYIDTPVKRYSSGMKVRLAFAVAAHLEPDILVIDEVLAVGDAEFQKKAIGKMQDISKGDGRTVLFVSHNMAAVKKLCTRCIVLENGCVSFEGGVNNAVEKYLSLGVKNSYDFLESKDRMGRGEVKFKGIRVVDLEQNKEIALDSLFSGKDYVFEFDIINYCNKIKNIKIGFSVSTTDEILLTAGGSEYMVKDFVLKPKSTRLIKLKFLRFPLSQGKYRLNLSCKSEDGLEDFIKNNIVFDVEYLPITKENIFLYPKEIVQVEHEWYE